jgi:hypothetical protein
MPTLCTLEIAAHSTSVVPRLVLRSRHSSRTTLLVWIRTERNQICVCTGFHLLTPNTQREGRFHDITQGPRFERLLSPTHRVYILRTEKLCSLQHSTLLTIFIRLIWRRVRRVLLLGGSTRRRDVSTLLCARLAIFSDHEEDFCILTRL